MQLFVDSEITTAVCLYDGHGRQALLLRKRVHHLNHPPFNNSQPARQKKMKELAEQELKVLEAQHPTRFQHLKLQLKELIHLLDQEDQQPSINHKHSSIITQESCSRRKRQREEKDEEGCNKRKTERVRKGEGIGDAIKKAEACLHKIQTLKSFFLSKSSNN